jgi:hypothetical protein
MCKKFLDALRIFQVWPVRRSGQSVGKGKAIFAEKPLMRLLASGRREAANGLRCRRTRGAVPFSFGFYKPLVFFSLFF